MSELLIKRRENMDLILKLFSRLLVRAVFWKSSLLRQDKSANVSWEYCNGF